MSPCFCCCRSVQPQCRRWRELPYSLLLRSPSPAVGPQFASFWVADRHLRRTRPGGGSVASNPLEDAWNMYADLVLTIGLWAISIGSFGGLVTYPGDDPPFGFAMIGFLSMVCGLISLGFLIDSRYE
jgi:hypothetical protein